MKNPPLISIIIPVYKVEPYLRQCLDSVLAQTYPHWEAICINDGSPDNCGAILDEYAAKDSRFIVIHQENQGVSVARNRGLEIMQGKYLTLLDSDDWLEINALKIILTTMETELCQFARIERIDHFDNEITIKTNRYKKFFPPTTSSIESHNLQIKDRSCFTSEAGGCVLITEIIKDNNIHFETNAKLSEDADFIINYLQYTSSLSYISDHLYHYRRNSGITSLTNSASYNFTDNQKQALFQILYNLSNYHPKKNVPKGQIKGFYAIKLQSILQHYNIIKGNLKKLNMTQSLPSPLVYIFDTFLKGDLLDTLKIAIRFYLKKL